MFEDNPIPLPTISEEKIKLFWSKVQIGAEDECWPWLAGSSATKKGVPTYGAFAPNATQTFGAHRIAYFLNTGDNPIGFVIRHAVCDNPPCCNPKHLAKGTKADNNSDTKRKGRTATGDKNGLRLHPERAARGDRNGARTHPERIPRGERTGAYTHPEKRRRGTLHGMARLNESQVLEIREKYANGQRIRHLAKDYSVAEGTISFVVKRQTWRHI